MSPLTSPSLQQEGDQDPGELPALLSVQTVLLPGSEPGLSPQRALHRDRASALGSGQCAGLCQEGWTELSRSWLERSGRSQGLPPHNPGSGHPGSLAVWLWGIRVTATAGLQVLGHLQALCTRGAGTSLASWLGLYKEDGVDPEIQTNPCDGSPGCAETTVLVPPVTSDLAGAGWEPNRGKMSSLLLPP